MNPIQTELQNLVLFAKTIFYVALYTGFPVVLGGLLLWNWLAARATVSRYKR